MKVAEQESKQTERKVSNSDSNNKLSKVGLCLKKDTVYRDEMSIHTQKEEEKKTNCRLTVRRFSWGAEGDEWLHIKQRLEPEGAETADGYAEMGRK